MVLCIALSLQLIFSGCITVEWNKRIDDSLKPKLKAQDSSTQFGSDILKRYEKGYYLGIEKMDDVNYHHYVFPKIFIDSKEDWIELFVPVEHSVQPIILRKSNQSSISDNPAYIRYSNRTPPRFYPYINPKYISKEDNGLRKPFSTEYPSLIDFNLQQIGQKAQVKVGQRINSTGITDDDIKLHKYDRNYVPVCPENSDHPEALKKIYPMRNDCNLWRWSDKLESTTTDGYSLKVTLETTRYLGDIITIPLDIVTSPIQLPIWLYIYFLGKGIGGIH